MGAVATRWDRLTHRPPVAGLLADGVSGQPGSAYGFFAESPWNTSSPAQCMAVCATLLELEGDLLETPRLSGSFRLVGDIFGLADQLGLHEFRCRE
jgi:hypothetical protein